MGLFDIISRFSGEGKMTELAETIAARTIDHVWPRVHSRLATLGVNETRGYLRARAAHVIQQQLVELLRDGVVIKSSSLDRVMQMTLDVLQRQVTARLAVQHAAKHSVRRAA